MRSAQVLTQPQSTDFLPQIESLLRATLAWRRMSLTYLRDFALDLVQVALRQPDGIGQLVADWEVTLEEIEQAGDELDDILRAREEAKSGIGMTPSQLRTFLASEEV